MENFYGNQYSINKAVLEARGLYPIVFGQNLHKKYSLFSEQEYFYSKFDDNQFTILLTILLLPKGLGI
ncbi:MAG: hypothetical protein AAF915_05985 [Cyanobacteria bacterium P01_D01_bin.50]